MNRELDPQVDHSMQNIASKVTLTGNKCQCPTCGHVFRTVSLFDKHRKGGHCLTSREMLDRGWQWGRGTWRGKAMTEAQKAARFG